MATFYRFDGWVKAVLGFAVAGAQIYVCNQPADTAYVPPIPQANIYADSGGVTPLTQPIFSDGFGHYDFYAASGFYTIVIVNAGQILQVYPDQTIGFPSAPSRNVTSNEGNLGLGYVIIGNGGLDIQASGVLLPSLASLVSPAFLGVPTAPTASPLTSSTQIATTEYADASSQAAFSPTYANVALLPYTYAGPNTSATAAILQGVTWQQVVQAGAIQCFPARWKIGLYITASAVCDEFQVIRTLPGSLVVIDSTPITFGGSSSPTLAAGLNVSDAISLQIDSVHDYWFMFYGDGGNNAGQRLYVWQTAYWLGGYGGGVTGGTGRQPPYYNDYTGTNPISAITGGQSAWLTLWQGA